MKKRNNDYQKEEIRGMIKEIMRTRGLRSISVTNYNRWKNHTKENTEWLHSIKLNIEDGFLHFHGFNKNKPNDSKAGSIFNDVSLEMYTEASNVVKEIISNEYEIPSKIRRNILVKVQR